MRLKKLGIIGFKSFPQRTEIIFNQGITGIVGPNGSGKSNIGDAVRWVLGEQSARALRGAHMEDVIFNGTEKRKAIAYCEVSLVFENEDHFLRSDFAEVMVTRRVYRNGDSEYYLNSASCRLRDVLALFRDTGIGRDGYSLIGQGRIDEILSAKSEDRRGVFEEAAGIVTFRVRKEEAERKLSQTAENLTRVNDILEELSNRIGPLEEQARVARQYGELSAKLKELDLNIFLVRHDRLSERIGSVNETLEGLRDVMLRHEAVLNENAAERAKIDETVARLDETLTCARREQMDKNDALHAVRSESERKKQKIENAMSETERLTQADREMREQRSGLEALSAQGSNDADLRADALEKARIEMDAEQSALEIAMRRVTECEAELERHRNSILEAVNRLGDARNRQARQQAMCAQMETHLRGMLESEGELKAQQSELEAALHATEKEQTEAIESMDALRADLKKLEDRLRGAAAAAAAKNEEAQKLALTLQADRSRLRVMDDMARDLAGYSNAVRSAMRCAKDDPGVYGTVAQLLRVPREMETAVDMVLGGSLQNIVTDNDETAKRIIEQLKRERAGRATFLPLSAVRSHTLSMEERRLLSMPGCLGAASELVEFDGKFRSVMENLLGRTVVATDLACGMPIMRAGKHAFRLVTLDGDVMHTGGSMTGGTPQGNAVNLLSREREMKELRERVVTEEKQLMAARESAQALESGRGELRELCGQAVERVHQQEIAVARAQEHGQNAKTELDAHFVRLEKTRQAVLQLSQSIEEIRGDLSRLSTETASVTGDREALDQKTNDLQSALAKTREHTDELRERAAQKRMDYTELEHAIDLLRRDQARWESDMERLSVKQAEIERQKNAQNQLIQNTQQELNRLLDSAQAMEKEVSIAAERCHMLEEERQNQLSAQREKVRQSEETHTAHDRDSEQIHRAEITLARAEGDLKTLCDRIYNEYNLTYSGAAAQRAEGKFDLSASEREVNDLRSRIREMGPINARAVEEYASAKERFDSLARQRDDAEKAIGDLQSLIKQLISQMSRQFIAEFKKLDAYFRETFVRLFGGGHAELKLTDPNDPLECGIEVIAQPPGKKLQMLSLLSGGERALAAIAILFAMLKLKPTPFCILDEIEAALDEANIGYFADYLVEYAKTTQFVVITHRKGTMERCDALYGVSMEEKGVSSIVSVDLRDYQN